MRKDATPSITSVPTSAGDEMRSRMNRYGLLMAIRTICFLLLVLLPLPWPQRMVFAVGAVLLPYVAVLVANAGRERPPMPSARPRATTGFDPSAAPEREPGVLDQRVVLEGDLLEREERERPEPEGLTEERR